MADLAHHRAELRVEIPAVSEAFAEMTPESSSRVATHCTGWRAIQKLAATFPDAFIPSCVGTGFTL